MAHGPVPGRDAQEAVVGRCAVLLCDQGLDGLPDALAVLVEGAGLRSAVLRGAPTDNSPGELLAAAGELVQAVPAQPGTARSDAIALTVEGRDGEHLATLTVTGARPSVLAPLRAACAVLGLALAAAGASDTDARSAAQLLTDAEAERSALADALHDGPVQELVAARYAADLAARTGDAQLVREAVQAALVALRQTMWQLRPRGAEGLRDALTRLSDRVAAAGGQPFALHVDEDADALSPAAAVVAYRLVQACTAAPGTPSPGGDPVVVEVHRRDAPGGRAVAALTVRSGLALRDAARWRRTAAALGGDLLVTGDGLRLLLPLPGGTPALLTTPALAPAAPLPVLTATLRSTALPAKADL